MPVLFSSYIASGFSYGQNFRADGASFPLEVPQSMAINMIAFYFSDRAYDPNPVPFSILDPGGATVAAGVIPALLRFASQAFYPIQLDRTVTLQASVRYIVQFASLPPGDTYTTGGGVSQDILQEAAPNGYLGQAQWPLFLLGLMNILSQSQGLAYFNYGPYTDLFASPGYLSTGEIAMRFQPSQNGQLQSLEIFIWTSDGSANQVLFALRPDIGGHPGPTASNIITASLPANQAQAGTFAKVSFPAGPQLVAGNYYWIVMSSPSNTQPIVFGRLVNPYREYVLESHNDFASWGAPSDGPSDLGFRINTTGESIVNTVSGSSENNYFSRIAQSFVPAVSALVEGAWVAAGPAPGMTMTVSVESDSGDAPTGAVLAQGSDTVANQTVGGPPFYYVEFQSPVQVVAGTKYWLVVSAGSASEPAKAETLDFRADYPAIFAPPGGTHYELLSGSAWVAGPGAMPFILAGATSAPPPTPTTLTLKAVQV